MLKKSPVITVLREAFNQPRIRLIIEELID
jgi:hypothetical protein